MTDRAAPSSSRRLGRRIGFVIAIVLAVVCAFVVRLVDIQVVDAATYNASATEHRDGSAIIYGTRGPIVDRDGGVLAESIERYDVTISPKVLLTYKDDAVKAYLEELGGVTGQEVSALDAIVRKDPESDYAVLDKGLDLDQFDQVSAFKIPGLVLVRDTARIYPEGEVAGNLVGFLGTDAPLAGVELSEDQCLAATNGAVTYQRSADGVRIPDTEEVTTPSVDGGTVALTIDRDIQWYAQERVEKLRKKLKGTWAESIVVDTRTGQILALVDDPTLDPNDFQSAKASLTGSRAFTTPFEPGSIVKPMTLAMLLDQGRISPTDKVNAPYSMYFGKKVGTINDFSAHPSDLTVAGVLAWSSNTGIAQLAKKIPDSLRYQYMQEFGFGSKTDVAFPGQSGGVLPLLKNWDPRTRLNVSFGSGMSATMLQLGQAYQTIANGGVSVPLSLVKSCTAPDGTVTAPEQPEPTQVVSASAAKTTLGIMENDETFYASVDHDDVLLKGYRIAAKTGTAQVVKNGKYTNATTISFAAIAPADKPRYVVITSIGLSYTGQSHLIGAADRDILAEVLAKNHVAPSHGKRASYPIYW